MRVLKQSRISVRLGWLVLVWFGNGVLVLWSDTRKDKAWRRTRSRLVFSTFLICEFRKVISLSKLLKRLHNSSLFTLMNWFLKVMLVWSRQYIILKVLFLTIIISLIVRLNQLLFFGSSGRPYIFIFVAFSMMLSDIAID